MNNANPVTGQGTRERVAAVVMGALFVVLSLAILASSHDLSVGPLMAAIVVGALGIEALLSAARNRRCLLSRIGPLP